MTVMSPARLSYVRRESDHHHLVSNTPRNSWRVNWFSGEWGTRLPFLACYLESEAFQRKPAFSEHDQTRETSSPSHLHMPSSCYTLRTSLCEFTSLSLSLPLSLSLSLAHTHTPFVLPSVSLEASLSCTHTFILCR